MKNNAERAAVLIQQALREVGGDFALSNARQYLAAAFNELTKKHKKREKRDRNQKEMEKLSIQEVNYRVKKLDEMIKFEELNGSAET